MISDKFFKVWFIFVAALAVAILALTGFVTYRVLSGDYTPTIRIETK